MTITFVYAMPATGITVESRIKGNASDASYNSQLCIYEVHWPLEKWFTPTRQPGYNIAAVSLTAISYILPKANITKFLGVIPFHERSQQIGVALPQAA